MGDITPQELRAELATDPGRVDQALKAVSPTGTSIGVDELGVALGVRAEQDPEKFSVQAIAYLKMLRLLGRFSGILRGLESAAQTSAERANMSMSIAVGNSFFRRTVLARCRIHRNLEFQGSGCVVGPSLVLTCAHVLGDLANANGYDKLEAVLETGVRIGLSSAPVTLAPPSTADHVDPLPANDDDYGQDDDFALLRMRVPAGADGAVVALPGSPAWTPTANAAVQILHFPGGEDSGIGNAVLASFEHPSARWTYVAPALAGSSGGACFSNGVLIGIHQGAIANGKRMVPLCRFIDRISALVAEDFAPPHLWSLDGRLDGPLVIGRDDLFAIFAILSRRETVQRGLRIRRENATDSTDGLGYSVKLLTQLIARRHPQGHEALVLSWPQATFEAFDLIGSLAAEAVKLKLVDPGSDSENAGVASGETGAATVSVARADQLIRALQAKASESGKIIWLIIEHANVELGDHVVALENLATLAMRWPSLRVVIIGNETVRLPNPEYRLSDIAGDNGGAGYLVEYLSTFARTDVEKFVERAYFGLTDSEPDGATVQGWTDTALASAQPVGNLFAIASLGAVSIKLRELLRPFERPQ